MAPQAATCLLAATILVTVPAGHAQAAPPEPADPSTPSSHARPRIKPPVRWPARPRIDAATRVKVKAYKKYRRKVARQKKRAAIATSYARRQIGKPYQWGAEGPNSYDCSGLVMRSWQKAGVHLPRVSYAQYRAVPRKVSIRKLRPGDLVFFNGRGHVGMALSRNRFIHAPSRGKTIRIDRFNDYRRRTFAGAVRPGAPQPRKFPSSIAELAHDLDQYGLLSRKRGKAEHGKPTGKRGKAAPAKRTDAKPTDAKRKRVLSPTPPPAPEPRPKTSGGHKPKISGQAPDADHTPSRPDEVPDEALPETTFDREDAEGTSGDD
ncbi:hypothetical protein Acsp03_04100 [Actinomadura sp. NBRC 104412]|nr:hypothetical protein Acsp03_04100 [Actinomadura sp. NBRC 104412]